mmetsp:Transcript_90136/g.259912  ORF Transcript_90136/g.259912 Transcript_90136/m.259912 type:complete len:207 (-) Transcript_90136:237-857(-)
MHAATSQMVTVSMPQPPMTTRSPAGNTEAKWMRSPAGFARHVTSPARTSTTHGPKRHGAWSSLRSDPHISNRSPEGKTSTPTRKDWSTSMGCPCSYFDNSSPVSTDHTMQEPSASQITTLSPSGNISTHSMKASWRNSLIGLPVATSKTKAKPFRLHVSKRSPRGKNLAPDTPPKMPAACPCSCRRLPFGLQSVIKGSPSFHEASW